MYLQRLVELASCRAPGCSQHRRGILISFFPFCRSTVPAPREQPASAPLQQTFRPKIQVCTFFLTSLYLLHILHGFTPGTPHPLFMSCLGFVITALVRVHLMSAVRATECADVDFPTVASCCSCHTVLLESSKDLISSSEIRYSFPILIAGSFFFRIQSQIVMIWTPYLSATCSQVYIFDNLSHPFFIFVALAYVCSYNYNMPIGKGKAGDYVNPTFEFACSLNP